MIRIPEADCIEAIKPVLAFWETHKPRRVKDGDRAKQIARDIRGMRCELAFAKHLDGMGIPYTHHRHIDKCDFDVTYGGKVYLVDVKALPILGPTGRPCRYMLIQDRNLQKVLTHGWWIVGAAVHGESVWLSKCRDPRGIEWGWHNGSGLPTRDDSDTVRCCDVTTFDWGDGGWAGVVAEARGGEQPPT